MNHTLLPLGLAAALICPAFAQDTKPAYELVSRVTPQAVKQVEFQLDKSIDGFSLEHKNGKLLIKAPDMSNLTAGYGYFLRNYEKAQFSWNGNRLPQSITPSLVKEPVNIKQEWKWRYAYNYCTLSYTSAFWGIEKWTEELDMMALNGVNLLLVQAGLEKVWQLTLTDLGYPKEKIIDFIPNPASAAWWNMGNLEGHGGPVSQNIIDGEAKLGRFLTDRMKALGMTPVLQGFVGLVPSGLKDHYKEGDARYIPQGTWVDGFVRPIVLDPTTQAFQNIAAIWYKNLHKVYGGQAAFYGGDLFHEGGNSGGIDVTEAARSVQAAMQKASPDSNWVLQAWGGNPSGALLKGLEKDHALVLKLERDMKNGSEGSRFGGYQGVPWLWCELLNFGGNHNLYGGLKMLAQLGKLQTSRDKDNLQGMGLLSEGTETNPVFYELFFQRMWMPKDKVMTDEELSSWLKSYAVNRYGAAPAEVLAGLAKLEKSVYSPDREQEGCTESILCARPGRNVQKASSWSSGSVYYDPADVQAAAQDYLNAAKKYPALLKQETFRYDLIDVTRQFLSDLARPLLASAMAAYDAKDKKEFDKRSAQFVAMINDLDTLLATHKQWRFGEMYERAQAKGSTKEDITNMEHACKRLVSIWGRGIGALNDYANRELSGLMKDFYGKRWQIFFDSYKQALEGKIPSADADKVFRETDLKFEPTWITDGKKYTAQPVGDPLKAASFIMKRYSPVFKELAPFLKEAKGEKWTLRDGATQFEFNVSDTITSAGTYTATFQWEGGNSALEISKVALYEGSKLISEDVHPGWTGQENRENIYKITVPSLRKNLDAYIIKADIKGASGNDSSGKFTFRKVK